MCDSQIEIPTLIWSRLTKNYLSPVINTKNKIHRRQDALKIYDMTTIAYVSRPSYILNTEHIFDDKVKSIFVPYERSIDIDNKYDLKIAEYLHIKMSKNRIIIITGANGHLGIKVVQTFIKLNYRLILVDKKLSQLKKIKKQMNDESYENLEIYNVILRMRNLEMI